MDLTLTIAELVLVDVPGADGGDRAALSQTITTELARLLQARGLPKALTQATQYPLLQGPGLALPSPQSESLGVAIAQAIYTVLGGESTP
jgi:hypothetical protein